MGTYTKWHYFGLNQENDTKKCTSLNGPFYASLFGLSSFFTVNKLASFITTTGINNICPTTITTTIVSGATIAQTIFTSICLFLINLANMDPPQKQLERINPPESIPIINSLSPISEDMGAPRKAISNIPETNNPNKIRRNSKFLFFILITFL